MPRKTARSNVAMVLSQSAVYNFFDGADGAGDTGIVEHNVEPAEFLDRARDGVLDVRLRW